MSIDTGRSRNRAAKLFESVSRDVWAEVATLEEVRSKPWAAQFRNYTAPRQKNKKKKARVLAAM
jgi:hypothetical protein